MAYGSFVIQHDLTFTIQRGDIFIIMGGSGCGKSTLLRHLIGLKPPAQGRSFDTLVVPHRRAHQNGVGPSCRMTGVNPMNDARRM